MFPVIIRIVTSIKIRLKLVYIIKLTMIWISLKLKPIILRLNFVHSQPKISHLNYWLINVYKCWVYLILKILSFRSRSLIIFLKVNLLIVRPYLYAEILQKFLYFAFIFAFTDIRVTQIKINVDRGVLYIYIVIIYTKHLIFTKISTYNPKIVPRMKETYINFIIPEIVLSAPFYRHSPSWWIWSIIEIKILLLKIYINIL
jgi:hypothetical protein